MPTQIMEMTELSNYDGEGENYLEKKNTLPLATDWKVKTIDKVF